MTATVHGCNDADEIGAVVHVVGLAPRLKHVVAMQLYGCRNALIRRHVLLIVFV